MKKSRWRFTKECLESFFESIKQFKKIKEVDAKIIPSLENRSGVIKHFVGSGINRKNMVSFYRGFREALNSYDELERRNKRYEEEWDNRKERELQELLDSKNVLIDYNEELTKKKKALEQDIDNLIKTKISLVDDILKIKGFIEHSEIVFDKPLNNKESK